MPQDILPSRQDRLATLIRLGVMPSIAEEAIAWAERRGQTVPTPEELAAEPEPDYADDIAQARQWWLFADFVPFAFKRLLAAQPVESAKFNPNHDELGRFAEGPGAAARREPVTAPREGYFYGELEARLAFTVKQEHLEQALAAIKAEIPEGWEAYATDDIIRHRAEDIARAEIKRNGQSAIANDQRIPTNSLQEALDLGNQVQNAWATTSNNHGNYQDSLQFEAYTRSQGDSVSTTAPGLKIAAQRTERIREQAAAVFNNIYERTQQYFRQQGIGPDDELVIYRGMVFDRLDPSYRKVFFAQNDAEIGFMSNPLSSFSMHYGIAEMFAGPDRAERFGVVVGVRVPAKAIFAHWSTGFGCADEDEVVVMGDYLARTKMYKVSHYE